jgi:hypothetical protein
MLDPFLADEKLVAILPSYVSQSLDCFVLDAFTPKKVQIYIHELAPLNRVRKAADRKVVKPARRSGSDMRSFSTRHS